MDGVVIAIEVGVDTIEEGAGTGTEIDHGIGEIGNGITCAGRVVNIIHHVI